MSKSLLQKLAIRKQRITERLDKSRFEGTSPVMSTANVHYDVSERQIATLAGGLRLIHKMVKWLELDKDINQNVHLFKLYLPYSESGHVLNIAYNVVAGGTCLEHLEYRRTDDAQPNLVQIAYDLSHESWRELPRPMRRQVKTAPRRRPAKIKRQVVQQRDFTDKKLVEEFVNEFSYRPRACHRDYRMVVVWKAIEVREGQRYLFDDRKFFFHITNDWISSADEIVTRHANQRCHQENIIEQHKNGVHALTAPVDTFDGNWAYMIMASLAWSLKAWVAILTPVDSRQKQTHQQEKKTLLRMEFPTFLQAMINIPAQIIHSGRKIIYRLLGWNRWQPTFHRLWSRFQHPLRC